MPPVRPYPGATATLANRPERKRVYFMVNIPFVLALLVVLLLCTYVPWISLSLVDFFYGGR